MFPKCNKSYEEVSPKWADLIYQMLNKDRSNRITAMEALNHPILRYTKSGGGCCVCESLQPSVFVWNTVNTITSSNDFSICSNLWKIYLSNTSYMYKQIPQTHQTVCFLIRAKLAASESNVNEIDGLIVSNMMDTHMKAGKDVQLMLLKEIVKGKLDLVDTEENQKLSKATKAAVLNKNGEIFSIICKQWPGIEIDCKLVEEAQENDSKTQKIWDMLMSTLFEQQQLNFESNVLNVMMSSAVERKSIHWIEKLCSIFPNIEVDADLLKKAVTIKDMKTLEILMTTRVKQDNDPVTDETFKWMLQSVISTDSTQYIQTMFQLCSSQSKIFNQLLTMLFKQENIHNVDSYHETQIVNFTFLYDLFIFAAIDKNTKLQDILSPWLQQAKMHSLKNNRQKHTTIDYLLSKGKVEVVQMPPAGLGICIGCLKSINSDSQTDSVENVQYCQKCNFILCQDCVNEVMCCDSIF